MNTGIRVQRRDRPWVDEYVTVLFGPFDMPSADALRRAVSALADRYPESRLTWRLDSSKQFWYNDRPPESVVAEREWEHATEIGRRLDEIAADDALDPPLTLIRYPRHLGLKMSHSVGDGRLFLTIMTAVMHTAISGDVVPWPVETSGRFPLIVAALRTFGKHPALIKATVDDRHKEGGVEAPAVVEKPWTPSRHTYHSTMSRERADEIFAWGKQFAPQASRFALQVALVLKAFDKVGLKISDDIRVVVDLRRYIGWRYIDGNFVAGVAMKITGNMTPEEISDTIKTTNTSGRPLVGQMVTSVFGRGRAFPPPTSVDPSGLPRVTFSNLGKSPEVDSLPFSSDGPTVYSGSVPPEGPLGMTVLSGETSRVMSIDATFHDNAVDPALVRAALGLILSDPIGLLSESKRVSS